jgi:4-hydroxybenzoate polyprenyltransferase
LLLVPLITGAGVAFREGSRAVPVLLLLSAALALFGLRTPVESLLGTSVMRAQTKDERRAVVGVIAGLSAVAALALGALLWAGRNPDLWLIGAAAAAAFIVQAAFKKLGRRARMLSEMVGAIGLTSSAPAAYYVITGKFDATAWMLWLANLIFAGNQIHYVQVRIHTARVEGVRAKFARGWAFAVGQVAMALVLVLACLCGLMPWLALIAFVPILVRGWLYFFLKPAPLVVRRLGWSELGQAVAFCVLFAAAFAIVR